MLISHLYIIIALILLIAIGYSSRLLLKEVHKERIRRAMNPEDLIIMLYDNGDIIHYNKQLHQILIISKIQSKSELKLYNSSDECVYKASLEPNQHQYNISLKYNFPIGVYRLEIKGSQKELSNNIIID